MKPTAPKYFDGDAAIDRLDTTWKVKGPNIALNELYSSQSYGASLVIWDHTVLPATRQR